MSAQRRRLCAGDWRQPCSHRRQEIHRLYGRYGNLRRQHLGGVTFLVYLPVSLVLGVNLYPSHKVCCASRLTGGSSSTTQDAGLRSFKKHQLRTVIKLPSISITKLIIVVGSPKPPRNPPPINLVSNFVIAQPGISARDDMMTRLREIDQAPGCSPLGGLGCVGLRLVITVMDWLDGGSRRCLVMLPCHRARSSDGNFNG